MKIITTDVVYLGKATPGSGGGGGAVIDALNVTPSTSAQTITASGGTDGYSPVNVAAVTSAIDANIVAGNIKKDVSILGVTGSYEGSTPTGTIQITTNGTHDVTNYATADVNVPTTAPAHYVEKTVDANGVLKNNSNFIDLTGVDDIGDYALAYSYYDVIFPENTIITIPCSRLANTRSLQFAFSSNPNHQDVVKNIKCIQFPNLTTISGAYAAGYLFDGGSCGLESVIFDKLETLSGGNCLDYAFRLNSPFGGATLQTVSCPKLELVSGSYCMRQCFNGQKVLNQVNMPSLKTISGQRAFDSIFAYTALQSLKFESLNTIIGNQALRAAFQNCALLQSLWFYALNTGSFGLQTNQFNAMLSGVTGCTVHFPMAIQSTIGSWSDVTNGFGGTNTTVLYDIVTSLTGADGNTYTRQEKDSTSTATAWVYNDTLYYTSGVSDNTNGVNEPAVSDAIYSDAACTQSVTTITAIA